MLPVAGFEEIYNNVMSRYEEIEVTIGILIVDARQQETKEFIVNYLDRFNELSGNYIDFFLPGYYIKKNKDCKSTWINNSKIMEYYTDTNCLRKFGDDIEYCFDPSVYKYLQDEIERKMDIPFSYSPRLILVEINKEKCNGHLEYQDRLVIDLKESVQGEFDKVGQLFEELFELAKRNTGLRTYKIYFIKGRITHKVIKLLREKFPEYVYSVIKNKVTL
jgi:hypothetical protein